MGAPIDDTTTLSTIADAVIRDPLETPTGVMKRMGMGKSDLTRVLRKWARHRTKLLREARRRAWAIPARGILAGSAQGMLDCAQRDAALAQGAQYAQIVPGIGDQFPLSGYRTGNAHSLAASRTEAGVKESDLKLDVPAFLHEPAPPPSLPRPLWKRLLGIRP